MDTGGWSVNCGAIFNEAFAECSLSSNYTLDIIKLSFNNPTYQYDPLYNRLKND